MQHHTVRTLNHESGLDYPDFKQKRVTFLSTSVAYYVSIISHLVTTLGLMHQTATGHFWLYDFYSIIHSSDHKVTEPSRNVTSRHTYLRKRGPYLVHRKIGWIGTQELFFIFSPKNPTHKTYKKRFIRGFKNRGSVGSLPSRPERTNTK